MIATLILAHIAGLPIEEMLLPMAGSGAGLGVVVFVGSAFIRLRRRRGRNR